MRRTLAILAAACLAVTLAGCQQSKADLQRDAEFAKTCVDAGGHVWYAGWASEIIRCDFSPKRDR